MEEYVAKRLEELCETQGITKYRLAQLTDLSQTTIANIINAKSSPTIQTLTLICDAFGISLPQFFHSSDPFRDLTDIQREVLTALSSFDQEKRDILLAFIRSMQEKTSGEH